MQMDVSYQTIVAVSVEACFETRILMIETVSFTAIIAVQRWMVMMRIVTLYIVQD